MSTTPKTTLLFGEPIIVAEFARLLESKGREFIILNSIDEFSEDTFDEDAMTEFLGEAIAPNSDEDDEINEYYDEFAENVILDFDELEEENDIQCIVDCSLRAQIAKVAVLQELAELFPSALMICSTVTCTATEINALLPLASQVIGAPLIPGFSSFETIEVAPSLRTRDVSHQKALHYFQELGFTVELVEDRVGLVFPRMISMLINEAAFAVMEGVASAQDIDAAMKLGVNYPKGLCEWADQIGIDTIVSILDALYNEYHEPRYRCCVLLRQYLRSGWLGRATGRGFHNYLPMN